jgi:hypothetical protein
VDNYNKTRLRCLNGLTPRLALANHTEPYTCAGMTTYAGKEKKHRSNSSKAHQAIFKNSQVLFVYQFDSEPSLH